VAGRGRGEGKTPVRVREYLKNAVAGSSQISVARASGLGLYSIQRFLKGIGEPTQATLEKLAVYFHVSVAHLRGGSEFDEDQEGVWKGSESDEAAYLVYNLNDNEKLAELESRIRKFPELWEAFSKIPDEDKKEALLLFSCYSKIFKGRSYKWEN